MPPRTLTAAVLLASFATVALAGGEADPLSGAALFAEHCAVCHGDDAKGLDGAGSDIRDSIVRQVVMATGGGYEDMPEIDLTEAQIEAIVVFLNGL